MFVYLFICLFVSFTAVFEYCLQDIDKLSPYGPQEGQSQSEKENKKNDDIEAEDEDFFIANENGGIKHFIINRMAFAMFHDLSIKRSKNNKFSEKDLKLPQMSQLFDILWNIFIYIACFPDTYKTNINENMRQESFYLQQYLLLRRHCVNNQKQEKKDEQDEDDLPIVRSLTEIDYFDFYNLRDGTLLHSATFYGMQYYCQMLINDGFDSNRLNRFYKMDNPQTPYSIAKKKKYYAILSRFDQNIQNKQNKNNNNNSGSAESETSNDDTNVNANAIQLSYYEFKQQTMFSRYFLKIMGINVTDDLKLSQNGLYFNFSQFNGLSGRERIGGRGGSKKVLKGILGCIETLLAKKLPICQDLLILCFEFCKQQQIVYKDSSYMEQFVGNLQSACEECLSDTRHKKNEKKKKNDKHDQDEKRRPRFRSYIWFKEYLLHSNVWLCQYSADTSVSSGGKASTTTSPRSRSLLYDMIDDTVDKQLMKQQEYIWSNIENERKSSSEHWNTLLNFEDMIDKSKCSDLRQDLLKNGVRSDKTDNDLYLILSNMYDDNSNFDLFSEYNNKIYLTNLLVTAHAANDMFQRKMAQVFKDLDQSCKFQPAPVKLYDRCM